MRKPMMTAISLTALVAAAPVLAADITAPGELEAETAGQVSEIQGILEDRTVRDIRELPLQARRLGIIDLDTGVVYSNLGDATPADAVDVTRPGELGAEAVGPVPEVEGIIDGRQPETAGRAVDEQEVPSIMAPNEQVERDLQPEAQDGLTDTGEANLPEGVSPMITPGEGPGVEPD